MTEQTNGPITAPPDTAPDKLAPFRALFGMPVAVQFAAQTPYVQIAPLIDKTGLPATVQVPNTNRVIGLPAVAEQQQATSGAVRGSRCSGSATWLVITECLRSPRC